MICRGDFSIHFGEMNFFRLHDFKLTIFSFFVCILWKFKKKTWKQCRTMFQYIFIEVDMPWRFFHTFLERWIFINIKSNLIGTTIFDKNKSRTNLARRNRKSKKMLILIGHLNNTAKIKCGITAIYIHTLNSHSKSRYILSKT